MGPYNGRHTEDLRIPYGDVNYLVLPEEEDYVMAADIFPTGYHAAEVARGQPTTLS
jgi:glutathione-independent formaldehyde dehydrogenase